MYSYKRTPLSVEVNKALRMLLVTVTLLLVGVSAYFFVHMSVRAEKGSLVRENQLTQQQLEDENRLLKEQVLEAQSLDHIQSSDEVDGMEPADNEVYMEPFGPLSKSRDTSIMVD